MRKTPILFCSFFLFFAGCYKNHLQVQQTVLTQNFLASSWVGSADPRQKNPPEGESLIVSWDFPPSLFKQELFLETTIRFWDLSEEIFSQKIEKQSGWKEYLSLYNLREKKGKILSYKAVVKNKKKRVVAVWEHPFWIKKIEVDQSE